MKPKFTPAPKPIFPAIPDVIYDNDSHLIPYNGQYFEDIDEDTWE